MTKADGVKQQLAQRAKQPQQEDTPERMVAAYLKKMEPQFAQVLPKHVGIDRLLRISMTLIRQNPRLLECNLPSLLAAVMQSAQLGLEPGLLGHCYIVPYGKEATFIIGYRGMIDLARRSGHIQSIVAHEVYLNDFLEMQYGLDEKLIHIPWHLRTDTEFKDEGDIRGFYMVAKFKDGGHFVNYMPKQEVDAHRKRSKAAGNGPWVTDYVEMGKKTVVRAGWKWLPISVEIASQVAETDETTRTDITDINPGDIIIEQPNNDAPGNETDGNQEAPDDEREPIDGTGQPNGSAEQQTLL